MTWATVLKFCSVSYYWSFETAFGEDCKASTCSNYYGFVLEILHDFIGPKQWYVCSIAGSSWVGGKERICFLPESKRNRTLQGNTIPATYQPDTKLCERVGANCVVHNYMWLFSLTLQHLHHLKSSNAIQNCYRISC